MPTLAISTDLASNIYQQSLQLRREVFIIEQGVSEALEIEQEESSIYFLLTTNHSPIATARLKIRAKVGKIQRVAVKKAQRGTGMGRHLMQYIEQWARENNIQKLTLGAQMQAIGFYEKLGYRICSDQYLDANILHQDMEKRL